LLNTKILFGLGEMARSFFETCVFGSIFKRTEEGSKTLPNLTVFSPPIFGAFGGEVI